MHGYIQNNKQLPTYQLMRFLSNYAAEYYVTHTH